MSEPRSPFDEPEVSEQSVERKRQLPARKWSFVALAVVLFVLVWVRELTGMSPALTISVGVLVLVGWSIVHISVYTDWRQMERLGGRSGVEIPEQKPRANGRSIRTVGLLGLIAGIWLQTIVPMSPVGLTLVVGLVVAFVYGSAFVASRL